LQDQLQELLMLLDQHDANAVQQWLNTATSVRARLNKPTEQ
jgi:hypothetical protein